MLLNFTFKAYFLLEIFIYNLVMYFGYKGKQIDRKAMVNLQIYDARDQKTNNCNSNITQRLDK